jgi:uncharacterized protein (TIGR02996 family)
MTDGQVLLDRCLLLPSDFVARKVFADWLDENGEPELAVAMRGDRAEEYLVRTHDLARELQRYPCLRLLWTVVLVIVARMDRWQRSLDQDTAEVNVHAELPAAPRRRGVFRRLFRWW